jgi:CBS-domain-containing membrane protein
MPNALGGANPYPTVAEIMQRDVVSVTPGMHVRELARFLERRKIHGVPVVDDRGDVLGTVSATDLLWLGERVQARTLLEGQPWKELDHLTVLDVMTPDAFGVEPAATFPELVAFFTRTGVHRAFVLEGRKVVGVVSVTDLLRVIAGPDPAVAVDDA